ncbi:hypothetical protein Lwal_0703 [Legionella waltersii]|uniref:Dot/Icm T4SS effector n=2 Tax=Legionella waltersii TaxID=66969 RepID=A0A0W1ALS3_9GAMM|nr:hypothetical protein Lwal_0703 [Legionella waltersii]SNV10833.1 Uncharacterised protein [Legionella waltersii]
MGKGVLVFSLDFDGCLGNGSFKAKYNALLIQYGNPEDIPSEEYEKAIVESNQLLFDEILRMSADYDRLVIMVGSNRTSAEKDRDDGKKNGNGSAYRAIEHFASALRKKKGEIPVEVNKRVLFDSILGKPSGYNFDLQEEQTLSEQHKSDYAMSGDSKYRLSYMQIQDVCASYPDSPVTYVHVDDRDDIVTVSANTYSDKSIGDLLPTNLKEASFLHYEEYNPIAHLLRLQRQVLSTRQLESIELQKINEQMKRAIDVLVQDMRQLVQLTESRLDELDEPTRLEIQKAKTIIDKLDQVDLNGTSRKSLITALDIVNQALNSNVQYKKMRLPSDIQKAYSEFNEKLYKSIITEFGKFQRPQDSVGFTIPAEHYDLIASKSGNDNYSESSDPMSILKQITADSRAVELDLFLDTLKSRITFPKKGDKWSQFIKNNHQIIDDTAGNDKTRDKENALIHLSNVIFSCRKAMATGEMSYGEAMNTIKHAVDSAIDASERVQKTTFFGYLGLTKSDVARQLKAIKIQMESSFKTEPTNSLCKDYRERVNRVKPHEENAPKVPSNKH